MARLIRREEKATCESLRSRHSHPVSLSALVVRERCALLPRKPRVRRMGTRRIRLPLVVLPAEGVVARRVGARRSPSWRRIGPDI
jgi:hypothetical protein